ncbi:MAG: ParB N-terminal domain-containing protein [Verrucomicrobiota bacterium]|nr:ParB N-terminal domain-containing protein [Verrucomicrobiota bacterium]
MIFEEIQKTPSVDLAIPFVCSYRSCQDRKEDGGRDKDAQSIAYIPIDRVKSQPSRFEPHDVEQLLRSIQKEGLLQPVIVVKSAASNDYEILAGHLRLEACKKLGWKVIPAIVCGNVSEGKIKVLNEDRAGRSC